MEIKDNINVKKAYWRGEGANKSMMVELSHPEDKGVIFSHVSNLKGKRNARRRLFFINDDLSEEEREQRNYFKQLKKENELLDEEQRMEIKLHRGRLLVNNQQVHPKLTMLTPADILTLEPKELDSLQ